MTGTSCFARWRVWVIKERSTNRNTYGSGVLGTNLESDRGVVDFGSIPLCIDGKIVFLIKEKKTLSDA